MIAPKGVKQIGKVTSRVRGELCTVIAAISASGNFQPPHIIFLQMRQKDPAYLKNAYPGTEASYNPNRWVNDEIFTIWQNL